MKNFCVLHILLFILLMLVYQCTKAQGFVVTVKGDTIQGEVKPITFGPEKKVQVTTADKKKNIFPIFQVRSFSYKEETYQPVKGEKGYVFMKLIKPGYLSLYAFQQENQVTYDGLYLLKKDGTGLEVPNLAFKKMIGKFLSDCPDVTSKINSGELTKKSIHKIIDDYNACIQDNTRKPEKVIVQNNDHSKKIERWETLEEKVKAKADFEGKGDALEMISDIKAKIKRNEKIPNFLLEGLKSALVNADVSTELEDAFKELNN